MDDVDADFALALQLQQEEEERMKRQALPSTAGPSSGQCHCSLVDPSWELTDPSPDIRALFLQFNDQFFWGKLAGIEIRWSPRMTLCAGLCVYEGRHGLCSVRLSEPLLKLRPRKDLVETLLHEMIHAYLFVTDNNKDHDAHGPEFLKHMHRINKATGANISVYHSFHDEVDEYRQHWWRCDGPCRSRPPYFGYVKRAMNRAPSHRDFWWPEHQRTCGGTYTKVKEPENYGKKAKKDVKKNDKPASEGTKFMDIRNFITIEDDGNKPIKKIPDTSGQSVGGPSSKPNQTAGPSSKPSQTAGPSSKPNQTAGPSSKPNQTAGPSSKPNQTAGPSSKPNQTAGPSSKPNQTAGPSSKPNQTAGPSSKPNQTAGPSSKPNQTAGPSSKPNQTAGPSSKPNQTAGPSSKPNQTGGPSSKPNQTAGPSSKPNQTGGPSSKPNQTGGHPMPGSSATRETTGATPWRQHSDNWPTLPSLAGKSSGASGGSRENSVKDSENDLAYIRNSAVFSESTASSFPGSGFILGQGDGQSVTGQKRAHSKDSEVPKPRWKVAKVRGTETQESKSAQESQSRSSFPGRGYTLGGTKDSKSATEVKLLGKNIRTSSASHSHTSNSAFKIPAPTTAVNSVMLPGNIATISTPRKSESSSADSSSSDTQSCPVCHAKVNVTQMNSHLDSCLAWD